MRPAALALIALALLGCDRVRSMLVGNFKGPPRPPTSALPRSSASPSASTPAATAPSGSSAPPSPPLDAKVRRAMKLAPLRGPQVGLALGKGRIAALAEDALIVRDTTHFEEVARLQLRHPRNLTTLADGSFLAADAVRTLVLEPWDTKARVFPLLIVFPETTLFADRRTPERFWALAGLGNTLYGYDLAPSDLSILLAREQISLDGYDGRAFGPLRDGSFMYSTATGFRRFWGPSRKDEIAGDPKDVFRLLPGSRVDTVWVLTREHAELRRVLAGKLYHLRTIPLETAPLDAAADGEFLALLELVQPSDRAWSMILEVFDIDGKRHLHESISAPESFDEKQWLRVLLENRKLALRAEPPLVAVGGAEELMVWDAKSGERVH